MGSAHTPLTHDHASRGANLVDFAGYLMPVSYSSILDEARHVRSACGVFDLCHMGRLRVSGDGHLEWMNSLVSCPLDRQAPGRIRYGLLTREDSTIIDDILVYREEASLFLCVNASNRHRGVEWLRAHAAGTGVIVEDSTEDTSMIAIQGPQSVALLSPHLAMDPDSLSYYGFAHTTLKNGVEVMVSRTGYTGEDGFELVMEKEHALETWNLLLTRTEACDPRPIGLGARDTLRLEAGMPLYGHEIDDNTTPAEADLLFAVDPDYRFLGGECLRKRVQDGTPRRLVGLVTDGRRVPRQGAELRYGDQVVGEVCSGTLSPTLGKNIATAYVDGDRTSPGTKLVLDLRGQQIAAEIVELPFYRRSTPPNKGAMKS